MPSSSLSALRSGSPERHKLAGLSQQGDVYPAFATASSNKSTGGQAQKLIKFLYGLQIKAQISRKRRGRFLLIDIELNFMEAACYFGAFLLRRPVVVGGVTSSAIVISSPSIRAILTSVSIVTF